MRKPIPVVAAAGVLLAAGCSAGEHTVTLEEPAARLSYSIGYQVGGDFRHQDVDLDPELVLRGIQDAMAGGESLLAPAAMRQALVALQKQVADADESGQDRQQVADSGGMVAPESFLAKNAGEPGIVTLPSGLQYRVIREGDGKSPGATDTVTVHYRGSLTDGGVFDSSYPRGEPATFAVNHVIAGWTEALQLMREGAKWELFIPPGLAYGERGAGSRIPPNSVLVFEVELLAVN
jgi:FKBP-type peptidyl-prolyl cis-trans isomerase FklB